MNCLKKLLIFNKYFGAIYRSLATRDLVDGCQSGNVKAVQTALKKGANINTMVYIGRYIPGLGYHSEITCKAYVSPLILAATKARKAKDDKPYKEIISLLLKQQDIDLKKVAMDIEVEHYSNDLYQNDKSIQTVLNSDHRTHGHRGFILFSEQNYPITDEMASFIRSRLPQEDRFQQLTKDLSR